MYSAGYACIYKCNTNTLVYTNINKCNAQMYKYSRIVYNPI